MLLNWNWIKTRLHLYCHLSSLNIQSPLKSEIETSLSRFKIFITSSHAYCSFRKKFLSYTLNNLRPRQNCHHFGDVIFIFGFMNGNHCIFSDIVKVDTDTECRTNNVLTKKLNWNHAPNIVHLPMQWNAMNTSHGTQYITVDVRLVVNVDGICPYWNCHYHLPIYLH